MRERRPSVAASAAGGRATRPRGAPHPSAPLDKHGPLPLPAHLRRAVAGNRCHRQPIANPAHRVHIARLLRIRLQFPAQIVHPGLHQASAIRVTPMSGPQDRDTGTPSRCTVRETTAAGLLRAYPEYPVAEEDRLGRSGAASVHRSGFIRCTVRRLFGAALRTAHTGMLHTRNCRVFSCNFLAAQTVSLSSTVLSARKIR